MTSNEQRYKTPEAARRAVTDKLKVEAAASSWRLGDLQRQPQLPTSAIQGVATDNPAILKAVVPETLDEPARRAWLVRAK